MEPITRLIQRIEEGDEHAAKALLPMVYDELRRLAEQRLAHEPAAAMTSATSLVHDAYLRLLGPADETAFANRAHFFSAAAEAMRRILIERARKRQAIKHGGGRRRLDLDTLDPHAPLTDDRDDELLAIDEALDELANHDERAAELVKLRFFGGLKHQEAADVLGLSRRQADGLWVVARTWLFQWLTDEQ